MASSEVRLVGVIIAAVAVITAAGAGGVLAAMRANEADAADRRESAAPTSSSSASPSPSRSPAPVAAPKCVAADATGSLGGVQTDTAHTTTATLIITNVSAHTCTIYGYGGVEMYASGDGRAINIRLRRDPAQPPRTITLKSGGTASKPLAWLSGAVPNDPACSPSVGFVSVILPDDSRSFQIKGDLGQVCLAGAVNGGAFR